MQISVSVEEFKRFLNGIYAKELAIKEDKKLLKDEIKDYADQLHVSPKAVKEAYKSYKNKMEDKDSDYLETAEAVELLDLVEIMFGTSDN